MITYGRDRRLFKKSDNRARMTLIDTDFIPQLVTAFDCLQLLVKNSDVSILIIRIAILIKS